MLRACFLSFSPLLLLGASFSASTFAEEMSSIICNNGEMTDERTVRELQKRPNFKFDHGDLRCVLELNKANTLKIFLGRGVSPDSVLGGGVRLLNIALSNAAFKVAQVLLDHKADVTYTDEVNLPLHALIGSLEDGSFFDLDIAPPSAAMKAEGLKVLKLLVALKANLAARDSIGFTPVAYALALREAEIASFLLEKSPPDVLLAESREGTNAVYNALSKGTVAQIRIIRSKVAPSDLIRNSYMEQAWVEQNIQVISQLLDFGFPVNQRLEEWDGKTYLSHLSDFPVNAEFQLACAELFLKHHADPNLKDNEGRTALANAISAGNIELAAYFRNKGARE
jgi:ankyrin repeat protein